MCMWHTERRKIIEDYVHDQKEAQDLKQHTGHLVAARIGTVFEGTAGRHVGSAVNGGRIHLGRVHLLIFPFVESLACLAASRKPTGGDYAV